MVAVFGFPPFVVAFNKTLWMYRPTFWGPEVLQRPHYFITGAHSVIRCATIRMLNSYFAHFMS